MSLNSKSIYAPGINALFKCEDSVTTGKQYGEFTIYFANIEFTKTPSIVINPIDGVSFIINEFNKSNNTNKINGVTLQAIKNGKWYTSANLDVTLLVLGS